METLRELEMVISDSRVCWYDSYRLEQLLLKKNSRFIEEMVQETLSSCTEYGKDSGTRLYPKGLPLPSTHGFPGNQHKPILPCGEQRYTLPIETAGTKFLSD